MRPELTELSAALLAITPERRRVEKPEIALRDARRTAMALLQAWPEDDLHPGLIRQADIPWSSLRVLRPDYHRVLGADAVLGMFDALKVEARQLTLSIMPRGEAVEVHVNAEGGPGAHHILAEDISANSIQVRVRMRGID